MRGRIRGRCAMAGHRYRLYKESKYLWAERAEGRGQRAEVGQINKRTDNQEITYTGVKP